MNTTESIVLGTGRGEDFKWFAHVTQLTTVLVQLVQCRLFGFLCDEQQAPELTLCFGSPLHKLVLVGRVDMFTGPKVFVTSTAVSIS